MTNAIRLCCTYILSENVPMNTNRRGFGIGCAFIIVPEQKARVTYDNLIRLIDDPDILDPLKFLREREIVHYQRFGEAWQTKWNDYGGAADKTA